MPKREREKGDVDQHNNRENERYRDVEREREGERKGIRNTVIGFFL